MFEDMELEVLAGWVAVGWFAFLLASAFIPGIW